MKHLTRLASHRFSVGLSAVIGYLASAAVAYAQQGLQNPLQPQYGSIAGFIAGALKALVVVALPIITLFIVISGFMFVAARGNQSKLEKAKENFVYVIIGALLILGAWVLATLIGGTVSQVVGQ
jgi:hypothetical protein